jgi:hypothetical protein
LVNFSLIVDFPAELPDELRCFLDDDGEPDDNEVPSLFDFLPSVLLSLLALDDFDFESFFLLFDGESTLSSFLGSITISASTLSPSACPSRPPLP